jgi:hypothetical protein
MAILAVVLAIFVWQQEGDGDGDSPLNAIAAAAERTQSEPGGRATMKAIVTSPERSGPFTMTGQMVYDTETGLTEAVVTAAGQGAEDLVEVQMVSDEEDNMIYLRSEKFGDLPGGSEWMGLDLSLGRDLDQALPVEADAKGELELLEEATGGVRKLGRENVRGVPTTRYRGTVALSEQVDRARKEGAEEIASYLEKEGSSTRIEAWIDGDGLVRRMRVVGSKPVEGGEGTETIDMQTDFYEFGPVPEIDLPESSEVFDATPLIEEELGISNE